MDVLPALAAGAVAVGAVAQAATGFGFSLIAAAFLVAAHEVPLGVQLNLVLSMAVNVGVLARTVRHADLRIAARLSGPAVVTSVSLGALIRATPGGPWTLVAGVVCLVAVVLVARGLGPELLRARGAVPVVGAVSGAMNVAAGIAGPPVVLLAIGARWSAAASVATMQVFFIVLNVAALATLGLPGRLPAEVVAAAAVGLVAGLALAPRLPPAAVRRATLLLAATGSLLAIGRGLATAL